MKGPIVASLSLVLFSLFALAVSRYTGDVPSLLVGRPAPPFTLERLTGDSVRLADYAGGVVLVNFWASWCVACEQEHPVLEHVNRRYGPHGAQLLGVVYQDNRGSALRWLGARGGVHWPHGIDRGSRVALDYGLRGVPETFFIARDGRVAYHQIGPVSPALVDSLVPRLLAEPPASAKRPEFSPSGSAMPNGEPEGK